MAISREQSIRLGSLITVQRYYQVGNAGNYTIENAKVISFVLGRQVLVRVEYRDGETALRDDLTVENTDVVKY